MPDWKGALDRAVKEVVAPDAGRVDAEGVFPEPAMAALAEAGLLGLTSATKVGGGGGDLAAAAHVVERLSAACGSTAMIVLMHYTANAAIEAYGPDEVRQVIASGTHLATLAFSEAGSRSHFWATQSTATESKNGAATPEVCLDAKKSWVTAAAHAQSYVWSSQPLEAEGPMTLWLVPADSAGLHRAGGFDGMGLRGNESVPVTADGVRVPRSAMLGDDGAGLDLALMAVLPWFLILSGAFSSGIMEAVTAESARHLGATRLEHLDQALIDQPLARADLARMRLATDTARTLVGDTIAAVAGGREDAMLRVLEVKAVAAETALQVTDLAMKVCGGSAFRKELGIERRFRDSRAARVMAPTTDALLDFVGRVVGGLPLFGP